VIDPMNLGRRHLIIGAVAATTAVGYRAIPTERVDNKKAAPKIDLEALVPTQFGDWRELPGPATAVNPQTQALLDKLYSQILARTYVHKDGYAIMLSLSYGADQRGALEAHKPEVCYPAQGFTVDLIESVQLNTGDSSIPVKRLATHMDQRREPLMYWFTLGSHNVQSKFDKRMVELKMAITGQIPDGLLFRVSSIDADNQRAWKRQEEFVQSLVKALPAEARGRLIGA
jgi:EpsI family protein